MRRPIKLVPCLSRARPAVCRRAATLIELLVVIALIGILAATMVPSLRRSMEAAAATVCKHNLDQLSKALVMYRTEYDGWLPVGAASDLSDNVDPDKASDVRPWFSALYPTYLTDPYALTCPSDPFRYRMARVNGDMTDPRVADYASFGINGFIMGAADGSLARVDSRQPTRPHNTILLADTGPDDSRSSAASRGRGPGPFRNSALLRWDDGVDPFSVRAGDPWLTNRHGRGINTLTLSGGVEEAQTVQIMAQPMHRYYNNCSSGGCTFCNDLRLFHYSFADDHLYWWTGPAPLDK